MSWTDGSRRRTLACTIAAALALCAAPTAARAACAGAGSGPGQASAAQLASATVCLLNEQRAAAGLAPLSASAPLATTASKYAAYMVSVQHFGHQDDGHNVVYRVLKTDPALAGHWLVFGENLGWGTYSLATPQALVHGWMNSPEHRANILDAHFNQIGVGIVRGAPAPGVTDALTYTTVFADIVPSHSHAKVHRASKRRHRHSRR